MCLVKGSLIVEQQPSQPSHTSFESSDFYKSLDNNNHTESIRAQNKREKLALARPVELVYADEVGDTYDALRKPLDEKTESRFKLSKEPAGVADLADLPFVAEEEIPRGDHTSSLEIVDFAFPLARVIGAESFADWTGRPPELSKNGNLSSDVIQQYTGILPDSETPKIDVQTPLLIVKDSDGEYWGVARDGTHRIAAAKLKGVDNVMIDVEVYPANEIPTLDFSVRQRFAN